MAPRKRFIVALIIVTIIAAFCGSRVAFSQDRAVPRGEGGKRPPAEAAPPARSHPSPEAAPQPTRPPRGEAGSTATPDAQRRRPRPDGRVQPNPPAVRPDARARHPRPQPHDAYRRGRYDWQHWQYDYWYPYGHYYLFPDRYPNIRWSYRYRGFKVYPHARLPYEGGWVYWPYENAYRGCGWYWVPTRRTRVIDVEFGWVYRYARYRYVYLCFD